MQKGMIPEILKNVRIDSMTMSLALISSGDAREMLLRCSGDALKMSELELIREYWITPDCPKLTLGSY